MNRTIITLLAAAALTAATSCTSEPDIVQPAEQDVVDAVVANDPGDPSELCATAIPSVDGIADAAGLDGVDLVLLDESTDGAADGSVTLNCLYGDAVDSDDVLVGMALDFTADGGLYRLMSVGDNNVDAGFLDEVQTRLRD